MADSEAPPIVSPEKRRRGPMPVLPAKTPTIVGSVDGVQQSAAGAVVTFMAYLLAVGTPRMVKVRGAEKHVVSVMLGDRTGLIKLELWGAPAQSEVKQLQRLDGQADFAFLKITGAEVMMLRDAFLGLKITQWTSQTSYSVISNPPPPDLAAIHEGQTCCTSFASMRGTLPPFCATLCGHLQEVSEIRSTRTSDSVQREASLVDENGSSIRIVFHGEWAFFPFKELDLVVVGYAEMRKNGGDMVTWVYDSAHCVRIGSVAEAVSIREVL